MNATVCLDADALAALLESGTTEGVAEYAEHLETCVPCQQTLAELADDRASWKEVTRCLPQVEDSVSGNLSICEPALERVMVQLKNELSLLSRTAEEMDQEQDGTLSILTAADDDRPELLGSLGGYEVQEVIGRGGMGVVFKAFDPVLHRLVAIKIMAATIAGNVVARQRFTREAQSAAAVCHEHIVTVYGVFEKDGLPYLVMQFVAGESLQNRLDHSGPLEVNDIVRIGLQTASGLAAAHAQGLIHRDIKPANLLLENGLARVRITDFGLARMTDDVQLTQNGVVAGTPEYMAPEQARGETVDHRADLFSLGSVLYALCTGGPPFRGSTALSVIRQVNDQAPKPIRELNPAIPVWLETLIARLMTKSPAERFQSAAEVAALLEGYRAHLQQPTIVPVPKLPLPLTTVCPELTDTEKRGGVLTWFLPLLGISALVLLAVLGLFYFHMAQVVVAPQQHAAAEVYQDFRNRKPLLSSLNLLGPDVGDVNTPEDKGLRFKLPPMRAVHYPVGIATSFSLSGDFEITVGYDLLEATQPAKGYGVGVSLNVATDPQRQKFAKVARLVRPKEGSTYVTEFWNNVVQPNNDYQATTVPTNVQSGQLRLVREGATIHCLVADGPGNTFREINQRQWTAEDLAHVHVEVVDSGAPGNSIDVRLVDLRIRSGRLLAEDGVSDVTKSSDQEPTAGTKGWLVAAELCGVGITAGSLLVLGGWLYVRQSRRGETRVAAARAPDLPVEAAPVSFQCSACGKPLRAKVELAGKKVRCSQCGAAVLVPEE